MSNFLAIATATAALHEALDEAVHVVSGAEVTTGRPDSLTDRQDPAVNAYLYQVVPNAAWRNADLPTRRPTGQMVKRPCAALDLFYLLSFYGNESELVPQRLLGSVTQKLHTEPLLDRHRVAQAISSRSFLNGNGEPDHVPPSDLHLQVDLVRFVPHALSLEDLSKLWSVFFQTPYMLSVAYQASVVLIEAEETPLTPLPVRERSVHVMPFRQPFIARVEAQAGPHQPIVSGSTLVIRGSQLRGEVTLVRIGSVLVEPVGISGTAITLPLPDELRAGVQGAQVVHQVLLGKPPTPHLGVESNVAAFVLQPSITQVSVSGEQELTVELTPPVDEGQRIVLLLNGTDPDAEPVQAFSIAANTFEGLTNTVTFDLAGVPAGDYLVRVQVDGATSPLEVDQDDESPTFNRFIAPRVTIG